MNQANRLILVAKPVLKQYSDAEKGITQGILMVERKSKKTLSASTHVQRITGLIILAALCATAYVSVWMNDESQLFMRNFYY